MKKYLVLALVAAVALVGVTMQGGVETPQAVAGKTYTGTVYVAGMGGHFSKADIKIDPSNDKSPIEVVSIDRVVIGTKDTHPTHDPRIDANDRTKMYWSTYNIDKEMGGKSVHVGLTDLTTGQKLIDRAAQLDDKAEWTGALYCASGQTKTSYIPVTMTDLPYIDVFDKGTMNFKSRVFLDDYKKGESKFFHGANNAQMDKFFLAVNLANEGTPNGKIDFMMLDLNELEKGKAKVLAKNTVSGQPGKTLTFRQTFTPDGKYVLQSAADRFFLVDAKTLKVEDEEMMDLGANHDAITTPDGKYAVLTIRTKVTVKSDPEDTKGTSITDGELVLYDIDAKKVVGGSVSVCHSCHKDLGIIGNATLCGADANWN